jgi:hypothetical protein
MLNATLDEAEGEVIVKNYFNIGIAVDVPDGLIVPVVKMADDKSVFDIGQEIQTLATAARERKLDLADLRGGTFSITNVGVIGGDFATPIINYPEVAILATMKIADRAGKGEARHPKPSSASASTTASSTAPRPPGSPGTSSSSWKTPIRCRWVDDVSVRGDARDDEPGRASGDARARVRRACARGHVPRRRSKRDRCQSPPLLRRSASGTVRPGAGEKRAPRRKARG